MAFRNQGRKNTDPPPPPPPHDRDGKHGFPPSSGNWSDESWSEGEEEQESYTEPQPAPPQLIPRNPRPPPPPPPGGGTPGNFAPTPPGISPNSQRTRQLPPKPTDDKAPMPPPPRGAAGGGRGKGGKGGMLREAGPRNQSPNPPRNLIDFGGSPAIPTRKGSIQDPETDARDDQASQTSFLHSNKLPPNDFVKEMKLKLEKSSISGGDKQSGFNATSSPNADPPFPSRAPVVPPAPSRSPAVLPASIRPPAPNRLPVVPPSHHISSDDDPEAEDSPVSDEEAIYDDTGPKWFMETVDRKEAESILSARSVDGTFIVRKARKQTEEYPYSLTVYYKGKNFNLNLRKRPDGRYAIGREKPNEDSFKTIPDMVKHHSEISTIQLKAAGADGVYGETFLVE